MSKECSESERNAILLGEGARLCFLGIGGIGMYAMASICAARGISVFGADAKENERTRALLKKGIRVFYPTIGEEIAQSTAVVCSLAIPEDHSDVCLARAMGIPIFTRGALLGALMAESTLSVAVSGSHGKSTVTAMLASILAAAGKNPTVAAGACLPPADESWILGGKDLFLAEACEYGDSFLSLRPSVSLFLNLEWDHPDYFPSEAALMRSFARAADRSGVVLYSAESPLLSRMVDRYGIKNVLSVGRDASCDFRYEIETYEKARATVRFDAGKSAPLSIPLLVEGRFQAQNAAMALAAASYLSLPHLAVKGALSSFRGIPRRLTCIHRTAEQSVYYDYAHHPTEMIAGIEALRDLYHAPITVVFRPHTFSRTEALFADFAAALRKADRAIVTDVDGAREQGSAGLSARLAKDAGGLYVPLAGLPLALKSMNRGVIVLMGAGDFSSVLASEKIPFIKEIKDS
jgi:UDP-N-acetylmuramate--alanine ligase